MPQAAARPCSCMFKFAAAVTIVMTAVEEELGVVSAASWPTTVPEVDDGVAAVGAGVIKNPCMS